MIEMSENFECDGSAVTDDQSQSPQTVTEFVDF